MDAIYKAIDRLTCIVISPQYDGTGELSSALSELGHVRVIRSYREYPSEEELERFLQMAGPSVVFLGIEDSHRAFRLAGTIDSAGTGTQVVVVSNSCDRQDLVEGMRVGVREFISLPLDQDRLNETMCRITEILERKPLAFKSTDAIFSFLPAKPGDGASTVALNVCSAITRRSDGKTLLADFDLNVGMVSFLLKITNGCSVLDALEVADRMDDSLWDNLILKRDGLDVLCSGRLEDRSEVDLSGAERVLQFARLTYNTICLDLSGNMEPFSMPLLRQSREIFLVCTSDIPSLHFARAKARFLCDAGFKDRASVVVNRSERRSQFSTDELEHLLGLRVRFSLLNDPRIVSAAMRAGTPVQPKSDLGRQFENFAESLLRLDTRATPAVLKHRFIEYFAVLPSPWETPKEKRRR